MKKGLIVILALTTAATLAVPGFAKDPVVDSGWAATPIRIDGASQDWQNAQFLTDKGSKVEYAVRNDGSHLYILFMFKDQMAASTIDQTGMKIYYDAADKKSKDLGVLFTRQQVTADELIAILEKRGETFTDERKAEIRKNKAYIHFNDEVINEKDLPAPSDPAVKTDPPSFRTGMQNEPKALLYEIRIPLSRLNQPGGIGAEPGQTIKIGFEWGGMTREIMKNIMAARASGGSMARESGSSSTRGFSDDDSAVGSGGGGGDFRAFTRDPRYKKHSFWIDVKLAAQ